MYDLDNDINECKKDFQKKVDRTKGFPIITFKLDVKGDSDYQYVIDDDYDLVEFPFPKKITFSASQTMKFIDEHSSDEKTNVYIDYLSKNNGIYNLSAL